MSKHVHVELNQDERNELERLIRSGNAPARKQTRARILLLSDRSQGQKRTDQEVAAAVLCSPSTVLSIRHRYVKGGFFTGAERQGLARGRAQADRRSRSQADDAGMQ